MPRPSAAELIERLRDVYEQQEGVRLADEKLAGRLPISLSTFNRWKRTDTRSYSDLMEMLERAGWLNISEDAPAQASSPQPLPEPLEERLDEIRGAQAMIAKKLGELDSAIGSLRSHLDDLPSTGRSFPRPRQGRTASR